METMQRPEEPAPVGGFAERGGRQRMDTGRLAKMSLEELLYYVLVGDGRRAEEE